MGYLMLLRLKSRRRKVLMKSDDLRSALRDEMFCRRTCVSGRHLYDRRIRVLGMLMSLNRSMLGPRASPSDVRERPRQFASHAPISSMRGARCTCVETVRLAPRPVCYWLSGDFFGWILWRTDFHPGGTPQQCAAG